MQGLRALALARRSRPALRVLPNLRTLSTEPFAAQDDPLRDEVLVEGKASARAAILNRPFALNVLNTNMALRLKKLYESWEDNTDIGFVIMKGSGRAFCAGGDVVTLYRLLQEEYRQLIESQGGTLPVGSKLGGELVTMIFPQKIGFGPDALIVKDID